jgi:hypothetical protein
VHIAEIKILQYFLQSQFVIIRRKSDYVNLSYPEPADFEMFGVYLGIDPSGSHSVGEQLNLHLNDDQGAHVQ